MFAFLVILYVVGCAFLGSCLGTSLGKLFSDSRTAYDLRMFAVTVFALGSWFHIFWRLL